MDDLLESIKRHIQDRISSPLGGACVVSLALWNYKLFVVLFSSLEPSAKLDYISTVLYPDDYHLWAKGVVFPLLSALAYLFIYPYPSLFVYSFNLDVQKKLRLLKQKKYDETPLTLEESRKLIGETKKRLSDLQSQIDASEQTLTALRAEITVSKTVTTELSDKLSATQETEQRLVAENQKLKDDLDDAARDAVELRNTIRDFKRAKSDQADKEADSALAPKYANAIPLSHASGFPAAAVESWSKHTSAAEKIMAGIDPTMKELNRIDALTKINVPSLQQYMANISPLNEHIQRATGVLDQYRDIIDRDNTIKSSMAALTASNALGIASAQDKDE